MADNAYGTTRLACFPLLRIQKSRTQHGHGNFIEISKPGKNGSGYWLRGLDLNQRPPGYEPGELPGCSTPRQFPRPGTGPGSSLSCSAASAALLHHASIVKFGQARRQCSCHAADAGTTWLLNPAKKIRAHNNPGAAKLRLPLRPGIGRPQCGLRRRHVSYTSCKWAISLIPVI